MGKRPVSLCREAVGWSSPLFGVLRLKPCGLGVVLECEENNVADHEGWSEEGRDNSGKDVSEGGVRSVLLPGMPWRSMRRGG
jgi:hypothetical protein